MNTCVSVSECCVVRVLTHVQARDKAASAGSGRGNASAPGGGASIARTFPDPISRHRSPSATASALAAAPFRTVAAAFGDLSAVPSAAAAVVLLDVNDGFSSSSLHPSTTGDTADAASAPDQQSDRPYPSVRGIRSTIKPQPQPQRPLRELTTALRSKSRHERNSATSSRRLDTSQRHGAQA